MPAVSRPSYIYEDASEWSFCETCGRALIRSVELHEFGSTRTEYTRLSCTQNKSFWSRHFGLHTDIYVSKKYSGSKFDPLTGQQRW